jgi:hypothetical protein
MCFSATQSYDGLPAAGPVAGPVVVLSCQRPADFRRTHWAHLCSLCNHPLTSRATSVGEGRQAGMRGQSVLRNNKQRTMADK